MLVAHVQLISTFYRALLPPSSSSLAALASSFFYFLLSFFWSFYISLADLFFPWGGVAKLRIHGFFLGSGTMNGFTGGEASSCLWSSWSCSWSLVSVFSAPCMALSTLDMPDLRVLVGLEYPRAS